MAGSGSVGVGAGFDILGLGTQIVGGLMSSAAAKKAAQDSEAIAGLQIQENAQRNQAMILNSQRMSLEQRRQAQQRSGLALTAATGSGSQFSTGLQGAYGNISGAENTNLLGISQNTQIGQNLFNLDNQISVYKMDIARNQSNEATDAGISAIGKGLMEAATPFSKIFA